MANITHSGKCAGRRKSFLFEEDMQRACLFKNQLNALSLSLFDFLSLSVGFLFLSLYLIRMQIGSYMKPVQLATCIYFERMKIHKINPLIEDL